MITLHAKKSMLTCQQLLREIFDLKKEEKHGRKIIFMCYTNW